MIEVGMTKMIAAQARRIATYTARMLAVVLVSIAPALAQQPASEKEVVYPQQLLADLAALRDAALASNYAYGQVAHLTENIGARPPGSPQAEYAVEYVAGELRKLGLEVHLEEVKVPRFLRGIETAELVEFPGQAPNTSQKIVLTALSGSSATPASGITGDVVVVRSFDELERLGRDKVAGKIVLFNAVFDKQKAAAGMAGEAYGEAVIYRVNGGKAAIEQGAVAVLIRSVGGADYRIPHTGYSVPANIPAGAVAAEDAELISHLASQGRARLHLTLTPQTVPEIVSHNVVADIKGTEHPEQIVIVSGHLDSWDLGTGAIDDAAGVAVAMETAHLIQQLKLRPKRTIRVIAWMDEENGGRGNDAYEKAHHAELVNHVGAIESDLGAGHPLGFNSKINPAAAVLLQPMLEVLQGIGTNLLKQSIYSPGSDIAPLVKAGVPGFAPLQDGRFYFNYHHTAADTLDKIDPRELKENSAAMAVLGYTLANLPETLPR